MPGSKGGEEGGAAAEGAIGHTRYSTTGSNTLPNVQPVYARSDIGELMLGHNGNLTNATWLRDELTEQGIEFGSASDTEVLAKLIAHAPGRTWAQRVDHAFHRAVGRLHLHHAHADGPRGGARSDRLPSPCPRTAARRRLGGRLGEHGAGCDGRPVRARRRCRRGAHHRRRRRRTRSDRIAPTRSRERLCVFEFVYLARPDSVIDGRLLYEARLEMGRRLAREHPADADLVIAVPDSAIPAAIGYAEEAGLPYREGLIKSRYVGRTFIQPAQRSRDEAVRLKFNPLPELLSGKRVVVVDDSIVRGTTTGPIVAMLRRAGAAEVHVRIHSPQMRHPCYMGVDTGRREELIAANHSLESIRAAIGADSLGYLSQQALLEAVGGHDRPRAAPPASTASIRPTCRSSSTSWRWSGAERGPHLPRGRGRRGRGGTHHRAHRRRGGRQPRPRRSSAASAASAASSASTRRPIPTRSWSAAPTASAPS